MNIIIGISAIAIIILILGLVTFFSGQQLNTSCSGEGSCSTCGGEPAKCENKTGKQV